MNPKIRFFSEEVDFTLKNRIKLRAWITKVINEEFQSPGDLNIVFCNDSYLLKLNTTYLGHDTFTDIITFPFQEENNKIAGDIFISVDRVSENATKYEKEFEDEIKRVMIHGVLHLLGYKDKTKKDKLVMRSKEDYYLNKCKT